MQPPGDHAQQQLSLVAANRRGMFAMSLAMAFFIANDAFVKHVSASLPSGQLIFVRGLMATSLLLVLCQYMGVLRQFPLLWNRWVWLRGALDGAASLIYLSAVFHMPLGNATAINLASPLFIVLFAMGFYGEKVGWVRGWAIIAGFIGVLLVVQPRADGFNHYALLCVVAAFLHAGRDILTRFIPTHIPAALITLSTAVSVSVFAGVWTLREPWVPTDAASLMSLGCAALFLASAYFLLIQAMRAGDMSVVAPFRYSGLLFALLIGYAVWNEIPNLLTWAGIILLVGAGLAILHSERRRHHAAHEALERAGAPD
jgi:drug/metabolite transporter (DMT)-like permease